MSEVNRLKAAMVRVRGFLGCYLHRRQNGPPKRRCHTTSLFGTTAQKTSTWISIQALLTSPWRWRHQRPPKRWYSTTTGHGATIQKTANSTDVSVLFHTNLQTT